MTKSNKRGMINDAWELFERIWNSCCVGRWHYTLEVDFNSSDNEDLFIDVFNAKREKVHMISYHVDDDLFQVHEPDPDNPKEWTPGVDLITRFWEVVDFVDDLNDASKKQLNKGAAKLEEALYKRTEGHFNAILVETKGLVNTFVLHCHQWNESYPKICGFIKAPVGWNSKRKLELHLYEDDDKNFTSNEGLIGAACDVLTSHKFYDWDDHHCAIGRRWDHFEQKAA